MWDTTLKTPHLPSVAPGPRLNKNVSVDLDIKLLAKLHFFRFKKCIIYLCISKCLCECMCTGVRGCTHLCKGVEGRRGCWMPSSGTFLLFILSRASPWTWCSHFLKGAESQQAPAILPTPPSQGQAAGVLGMHHLSPRYWDPNSGLHDCAASSLKQPANPSAHFIPFFGIRFEQCPGEQTKQALKPKQFSPWRKEEEVRAVTTSGKFNLQEAVGYCAFPPCSGIRSTAHT